MELCESITGTRTKDEARAHRMDGGGHSALLLLYHTAALLKYKLHPICTNVRSKTRQRSVDSFPGGAPKSQQRYTADP